MLAVMVSAPVSSSQWWREEVRRVPSRSPVLPIPVFLPPATWAGREEQPQDMFIIAPEEYLKGNLQFSSIARLKTLLVAFRTTWPPPAFLEVSVFRVRLEAHVTECVVLVDWIFYRKLVT